MNIYVITLFSNMFTEVFGSSMLWKAQDKKLAKLQTIDLRQFGIGQRKTVDDTPYGGGDGMVLKPEPLFAAVEHAKKISPNAKVLLMTPRGEMYTQNKAQAYSDAKQDLIIICGHYEGYDERITSLVDDELCIGNYVLTGGEIAAMVVVDSVVRLIPGVLGGETSAINESFSNNIDIEYPQYTRPEIYQDLAVPNVLLSGNHGAIADWRKEQSQKITKLRSLDTQL
ncbi:tRNA (guanosine(37)-N1)-methyltransferase TrmD [Candidatus Saccharibacteria bacterium]|nr:tRNA (guanosine(37)-N1)-methyltransferase TrmD [Candidatus Saccharibacteria bacterium]